jgi:hypothetical protein
MNDWLLAPPIAFLAYLAVVGLLSGLGRLLAGPEKPSSLKSSIYSGGEEAPAVGGGPGYRPFFTFALFFAILHLGVLIFASGSLGWVTAIYIFGLFLALIALILG